MRERLKRRILSKARMSSVSANTWRARTTQSVLVSACLMGIKCRYDGGAAVLGAIDRLAKAAHIVPFCPEVYSGLPTPRRAVEICGNRAVTREGDDVTKKFEEGARCALELAEKLGCKFALLKEKSPSCGSGAIYSGNFDRTLISGDGFTAKALKASGVRVFGESTIEELISAIENI